MRFEIIIDCDLEDLYRNLKYVKRVMINSKIKEIEALELNTGEDSCITIEDDNCAGYIEINITN